MSRADRRACCFRRRECVAGKVSVSGALPGLFHAWTVDHEEYDNGPGHFAAAIVEDYDGMVLVVPAQDVCFGTEPKFRN